MSSACRRPASEGRALSCWELIGEHLTGDRATYLASLKAVVTDLALADNVVMVGHGAGLFLGDMRGVVRVFVVAPMDDRVARFLAEGGQDADRARRTIEQRTANRPTICAMCSASTGSTRTSGTWSSTPVGRTRRLPWTC